LLASKFIGGRRLPHRNRNKLVFEWSKMRKDRENPRNHAIKRIVDGFKVMRPIESGHRADWLSDVIKDRGYTTGAEIGVARGNTTSVILERNSKLHLHAIDLFGPVPIGLGGRQYRYKDFALVTSDFYTKTAPFKDRLTVLRGLSWEMADEVEDNSLDFIFIDADHEYASVIKDIKAWTPKVKDGGMVSGHDHHFEEVLKAITELIPNHKKIGIDHCWEAKKEDVLL
jgi:hypothetical protein